MTPLRSFTWNRIDLAMLSAFVSASFWIAIIAAAMVSFDRLEGSGHYRSHEQERIGFASSFLMGGSLTLLAALAMFGSVRRSAGTAAFLAILLPLPAHLTLKRIAPDLMREAFFVPMELYDALKPGVLVGLAAGFIGVSAIVVVAIVTKRRLSWRVAMVSGAVLAVLMAWVIPLLISSSWRTMLSYAHEFEIRWDVMTAVMSGAIVGAIWGAVSGAMTSRWFRAEPRIVPNTAHVLHDLS